MKEIIKYWERPVLWWISEPVIEIKLGLIIGLEDLSYAWLGKITDIVSLIWGYNVLFLWWKMNSILLSNESQYYFW